MIFSGYDDLCGKFSNLFDSLEGSKMMIFFDVWGKNNTPTHYSNDNWLIPLINLAYIDVGSNY